MSRLSWDQTGERFYETGVKQGVLYPKSSVGTYPKGVAWNGLTAVTESPSGAEASPIYADDIKYLNLMSTEEFGATIEAYTYPDEFAACDGSDELATGVMIGQQERQHFGLCYKTTLGNDTDGNAHGYKIHLIYDALAAPSERNYASINDSPEAITMSWEVSTTPVAVIGKKPTASIVIDSTKVDTTALAAFEAIIYGDVSSDARLPLPDEIVTLFSASQLGALTITMTAGTDASSTQVDTVSPVTANGNKLVYKVGSAAEDVNYDDVLTTGWSALTLDDNISATEGQIISVAEVVRADSKARKLGSATVILGSAG